MILHETYTLTNGVEIPKLGLGTWMVTDEDVEQAVRDALEIGYRHFDTAQAYQNEAGVGRALESSGTARNEVFVTTKLAAEVKSYAAAASAIDGSLEALGLESIDLMLIHSPQPWAEFRGQDRYFEGNREAWKALEDAYEAGKLRAIGVSNFEQADLDNLFEVCSVQPMVNQILAHISNTPADLIRNVQDRGMLVEAYSPIGHGALLENKEIAEMARRYEVSIPRLSIRYTLQLGLLPLPKTANAKHMRENADVDFVITDEDMERLRNAAPIEDYGEAGDMPVFANP